MCVKIPDEILVESVDLFISHKDSDPFLKSLAEKRKLYTKYDKTVFVVVVLEIIKSIRGKIWSKAVESSGGYIVSCELVRLLQILWCDEQWVDVVNKLFSQMAGSMNQDMNLSEIFSSVLGGQFNGQSAGSRVKISSEISRQNINFEFIKKDFTEHFNYGTIIGFSPGMNEIWNKKSKEKEKDPKKVAPAKKVPVSNAIFLSPDNNQENLVGVLLQDSLHRMSLT